MAKKGSGGFKRRRPYKFLILHSSLIVAIIFMLIISSASVTSIKVRSQLRTKADTMRATSADSVAPSVFSHEPKFKPISITENSGPSKPSQPSSVAPATASSGNVPSPSSVSINTNKITTAIVPSPSSSVSNLVPSSSSTSSQSQSSVPGSSPSIADANTNTYSSSNWSGYVSTGSSYTAISGSWIAPTPTTNGSSVSADATWVGIGGVTSSDLIQVGTDDSVYSNGRVVESAFYEMLPNSSINISSLNVSPGNSMSASLIENSGNNWTISITNNTTGQNFTINANYSSGNSSAEWVEEDPSYTNGSQIPFDEFGTINFTNGYTTANGQDLSIGASQAASITMLNNQSQVDSTPSSLDPNETGFAVTRSN